MRETERRRAENTEQSNTDPGTKREPDRRAEHKPALIQPDSLIREPGDGNRKRHKRDGRADTTFETWLADWLSIGGPNKTHIRRGYEHGSTSYSTQRQS